MMSNAPTITPDKTKTEPPAPERVPPREEPDPLGPNPLREHPLTPAPGIRPGEEIKPKG